MALFIKCFKLHLILHLFQHEEQPKKSVAFQVDDQKEELKGAEVNIETTQKETAAAAQSETQITLEQKEKKTSSSHDEISSSVKGKLKKRITKQVNNTASALKSESTYWQSCRTCLRGKNTGCPIWKFDD